jgi:hypothetical protein
MAQNQEGCPHGGRTDSPSGPGKMLVAIECGPLETVCECEEACVRQACPLGGAEATLVKEWMTEFHTSSWENTFPKTARIRSL